MEAIKVAVWDTYVTRKNGRQMHFDIVAPVEIKDPNKIYEFGKKYLLEKGEEMQKLTSNECQFCHIEYLPVDKENEILMNGYFIIEIENCE